MGIVSRGFSGRRSAADVKLPPGQYLTTDFPVYIQACRVLGLVHNRSMGTTQRDKLDKLYIHLAPGTPLMLTRCPDLNSNPFEGLHSSTR